MRRASRIQRVCAIFSLIGTVDTCPVEVAWALPPAEHRKIRQLSAP
jgi:hypothetical protein